MGKPLNMNPEDYAKKIIDDQAAYIAELEAGKGISVAFEYSFSATTVEPPASGQIRIDVNPPSVATTKLWPHKMTSNSIDVTNALANFRAGDLATIQDKNDASHYARFTLTGVPLAISSYFKLPVTFSSTGLALNGGQPSLLVLTQVR